MATGTSPLQNLSLAFLKTLYSHGKVCNCWTTTLSQCKCCGCGKELFSLRDCSSNLGKTIKGFIEDNKLFHGFHKECSEKKDSQSKPIGHDWRTCRVCQRRVPKSTATTQSTQLQQQTQCRSLPSHVGEQQPQPIQDLENSTPEIAMQPPQNLVSFILKSIVIIGFLMLLIAALVMSLS